MASSTNIIPLAALLLPLFAAAAAYSPDDSPSIAEPPLSASPAPAPAPLDDVLIPMAMDVDAMDSRYLAAHMSAAAHKVEAFVATEVERRLADPATAEYERECLAVCKEVYESAAESMRKAVESVAAGDFVKANFDVSAFNTDVDTCSDCVGAGFDKFDVWAKAVAGDCLDRIVRHTNRI